jgi:phage gp46-like protein
MTVNLILDGDMEEAYTEHWLPGPASTVTKSTSDPHDGLQCLQLDLIGPAYGAYTFQDVLTVGTKYRLQGYARAHPDGGPPLIQCLDGEPIWLGIFPCGDWQHFDVSFTATNARLIFGIVFNLIGWYDSIFLSGPRIYTGINKAKSPRIDRYQGDPKLVLDEHGADLIFRGGQPVMDQGLENAALISLHTREGWCGNALTRKPEQRIGSRYELALEQPITLTALNAVRNAALAALQWMIDVKVASRVDVAVSNPQGAALRTLAVIVPPSRDPLILLQSKNGINWISQKLDPASARI